MSFNEEQKRELEKLITEILDKRPRQFLHQSDFVPDVVKREAIEDKVIVTGTIADRPTDNSTGVGAYFSTDTNIFSLYDGSEWVEFARIPASPATYTPTNSTTDRAWDCDTVVVAELADVVATLVADLQSVGLIE